MEIIFIGKERCRWRGVLAGRFGCTRATVANAIQYRTYGALAKMIRRWIEENLKEGVDYMVLCNNDEHVMYDIVAGEIDLRTGEALQDGVPRVRKRRERKRHNQ